MNVLVLFPQRLLERKVSSSRRHELAALARRDDVTFHLSGQGWPDWDNSRPALENVQWIMPGADVVLTYKLAGARKDNVPLAINPVGIADQYLVAQKWHETHSDREGQVAIDERVGLILLAYPSTRPAFAEAEAAGGRVAVLPHCAETTIFAAAARPWAERDIDCLVTGTIESIHYPLRCRWASLVRSGKLPGKVYPHPGLRADGLQACEDRVSEYAGMLGRSRISLVCSSRHRYPLAKYVESAAAGCLVIGDRPDSPPAWMARSLLPVDPATSDGGLVDFVKAALESPGTTGRVGLSLAAVAGQTQEAWASWFVEAVRSC